MADMINILNITEQKVKALTIAYTKLKPVIHEINDPTISAYFLEMENHLKNLTTEINPLKTELKGLGTDSVGLEKFNKNLNEIAISVDKLINKFGNFSDVSSNVHIPSTISQDISNLEKKQAEQAKKKQDEEQKLANQREKYENQLEKLRLQTEQKINDQNQKINEQKQKFEQKLEEQKTKSEQKITELKQKQAEQDQKNAQKLEEMRIKSEQKISELKQKQIEQEQKNIQKLAEQKQKYEQKLTEEKTKRLNKELEEQKKIEEQENKRRFVEKFSTRADYKNQFELRKSLISNMNTAGLDKQMQKVKILEQATIKAFGSGDTNKMNVMLEQYMSATDKIIGKDKEIEESQRKKIETQQNNIKLANEMADARFKSGMSYVANWELKNGRNMPLEQQLNHYKEFIKGIEAESDHYYIVNNKIRDIEAQIDTQRINEKQKRQDAELRQAEEHARKLEEVQNKKYNEILNWSRNKYIDTGKSPTLQEERDFYQQQIQTANLSVERKRQLQGKIRDIDQQIQKDQQQNAQNTLNIVSNALKNVSSFISNTVNRILGIIKNAIQTVGKIINTGIKVIQLFKNSIQRILSLLGNFGNRIGLINRNGNLLKGTFTELKSKIQVLTTAFKKLYDNQMVKNGESLLSSIQTLNIIVGGELTESTIEWANELERGFGLSASGLIADLKELTGVMKGLGMSGQDTNIASKNLVTMANALSSIIGYDTSTVVTKIQSGMKGMTQSIDKLIVA